MHILPARPSISDEFTERFLLPDAVRYRGRASRDGTILLVKRHTDVLVFQDERVTHRRGFHLRAGGRQNVPHIGQCLRGH